MSKWMKHLQMREISKKKTPERTEQNENETTDNLKLALALATKDVINAFEYYLKNEVKYK